MAASQTLTVPSRPPVTMSRPSGDQASVLTPPSKTPNWRTSVPVAASQMRRLASVAAEASSFPSGEKERAEWCARLRKRVDPMHKRAAWQGIAIAIDGHERTSTMRMSLTV